MSEFEADLQHHIHVENNIVFPRAIAVEQPH
jgi:iron-sulfur cluster repair protein YtfE (RIC family)